MGAALGNTVAEAILVLKPLRGPRARSPWSLANSISVPYNEQNINILSNDYISF